jgi:Ca2+/Na+ antiporter
MSSVKKEVGIFLTLITIVLLIVYIVNSVRANYQYSKKIESYWSLADKSSTIVKKSYYIDQFVTALEKQNLNGEYDAIWLQTADNSFDMNFDALKTLQVRLHEIEKMDITSFQYQTAIQQITSQEQGEAREMLIVFEGTWFKANHFLLWGWVCTTLVLSLVVLLIVGIIIWNWESLYNL